MRFLTPYTNRMSGGDLFREFDKVFADLATTGFNDWRKEAYDERSYQPACEVTETETHYLLSLDVPGMKREDIKIETNDNFITVSGERKREVLPDEKAKIQRYERSYGFFKRSFSLPSSVDKSAIEAHYEDGVLHLSLPKVEVTKARTIEVQTGKTGFFEKFLGTGKTKKAE